MSASAFLDTESALREIDEIAKAVKDIANGDISIDEVDRKITSIETKKMIKEREAAERDAELLKYGKPGKGLGEDYELWCRGCHTEYCRTDMERCERCGSEKLVRKGRNYLTFC
jgi:hypothetical protein